MHQDPASTHHPAEPTDLTSRVVAPSLARPPSGRSDPVRPASGAREHIGPALAPEAVPRRPELSSAPDWESGRLRLLVVDDDETFLWALDGIAQRLAIASTRVTSTAEAVRALERRNFDAALIDVHLDGEVGFDTIRQVQAASRTGPLPIIMVSSEPHLTARVAAFEAGATCFLSKPLTEASLQAAVVQVCSSIAMVSWRVLLLGIPQGRRPGVQRVLHDAGIAPTFAPHVADIASAMQEALPDLLVLGPESEGWETATLAAVVRSVPQWAQLPLVAWTDLSARARRPELLRAGVTDCLSRRRSAHELAELLQAHLVAWQARRMAAQQDWLSGLPLRGPATEHATQLLAQAVRRARPLSVALLDLDDFKAVNDRRGHAAGDRVIAALGRLLQKRLRNEDLRCRWGGEEFLVAMPDTDITTAQLVLARVLQEWRQLVHSDDQGERFTCSFTAGLASTPADGASLATLLETADGNLYRGKRAGRSRIVGAQMTAIGPSVAEPQPEAPHQPGVLSHR